MHVLVIDNDLSILELVESALKSEGVEVSLARSWRAAATEVALHHFDAILLDPDALQDGTLQFQRRLRALPRDIPVLVMSARSSEESLSGLTMPATRRQPIEMNALVEQVRQAAQLS